MTATSYSIHHRVFQGGERYCLLLNEQGLPLWYPNLFITIRIRNRSLATATMESCLSAIKILLKWSDSFNIKLEHRFITKSFLTSVELESLSHYAQQKIREEPVISSPPPLTRYKKQTSSTLSNKYSGFVSKQTHASRVSYISHYLIWLANRVLGERQITISRENQLQIKAMREYLNELKPVTRSRNVTTTRVGLSKNQRETLLKLININSSANPFIDPDIRLRNYLIVAYLYYLGLRQGECLNIRVKDINFQENTLLIARRADEKLDTRIKQPKVKTNDRLLPLSSQLSSLTAYYIISIRRKIPYSQKHDYLFISHKAGNNAGKPLSQSSIQKIFSLLKKTENSLPTNLSPHLLRHTANDRFSEQSDQQKLSESDENKRRSYLFGWQETSGTAATYTKRHTREKAMKAALELQRKLEDGYK